ncbi:transposase [Desulfobacula phenolica]|uniref:Transposase DDE domain-containing protein n=1 Tax=Desulfobacula phenolica TaxID=90732 RepID=A0A1H2JS06_9BACT|nr:transposase [Desulfobacula phenolica]SDU59152.1 Transposase DDE domain-containing protein [Desulfobacula phenolica]
MAKYKDYSYDQGVFLPVFFDKQILPGTFEYSLNHLIDNEVDLTIFDNRYNNDKTGAKAYDPRILLKIILFAYSRGITSSRKMFAVDGCKLPSNASKEWSGTKTDFKNKALKLGKAIERIIQKHREIDHIEEKNNIIDTDTQYIATLQKQIKKIRNWTKDNDDKLCASGKPVKSNITDNDSAKMKTSNGVIQGYNGLAMVDNKHQVIVGAEAFGKGPEQDLLKPLINNTKENLGDDVFENTRLTADSGFHTNKNMDMLAEENIDAYVADNLFRKRDPRFDNAGRYKELFRKQKNTKLFSKKDFYFDPEFKFSMCPARKRLYRTGNGIDKKGNFVTRFEGPKSACGPCKLRSKCLRKPDKTLQRQVAYFHVSRKTPETATEKMKLKIDSPSGRQIYSKRLGTVEPVFGHIRHTMKLNWFSMRWKIKVNSQWLLFCTLHNLKKIHRYGSVEVT